MNITFLRARLNFKFIGFFLSRLSKSPAIVSIWLLSMIASLHTKISGCGGIAKHESMNPSIGKSKNINVLMTQWHA